MLQLYLIVQERVQLEHSNHIVEFLNMADAAVDRNVREQVRDIIFDAIESMRKKSMWQVSKIQFL